MDEGGKLYMKKIFLLMLFLLIPLAVAEVETLGVFQINKPIDLVQTCSNCTYCNLTKVQFPNSTIKRIGKNMDKRGSEYNYSFSQTSLIGNYIATTCCDVDGIITCVSYDFEVNGTGTTFTVGQSILYTVFIIILLFVYIISLYGALKLPFTNVRDEENRVIGLNDLKYVKIFLWVINYLVLMSIFGLSRGITANYVPEIGLYKIFQWMYWLMFALVWPLIVCSALFALILFLQDKKINKSLIRGFPVE